MTTSPLAAGTWPLGKTPAGHNRYYKRPGAPQGFIVHHAAITSDAGLKSQYVARTRELSSNYAITRAGDIMAVLHEEYRPFTSRSAKADNWGITVEVVNETAAPGWTVSARAFDQLARLIADCATRWRFPIDREHVIGHREVRGRFGQGIATACPGGIWPRMDELVQLARHHQANQGGLTMADIDDISASLKRLEAGLLGKKTGRGKAIENGIDWIKNRLGGSVLTGKSVTELLGEPDMIQVDADQLAQALIDELGEDLAEQVVNELHDRLTPKGA